MTPSAARQASQPGSKDPPEERPANPTPTPEGRRNTRKKREEQIGTRQDESQWIVAQRPLSAPTIPRFDWIVCPGFPRPMMWTTLNTDPFNGLQGTCDIRPKPFTFVPVLMGRKTNTAYQHGF